MDHGGSGGGGRSASRLRDRLARMFRPASLLRSTCNTTASACSSSSSSTSSSAVAPGAAAASSKAPLPTASACSSSRALLAADAAAAVARDGRDSFLASSRRDLAAAALVARTESFSTAVDRLNRRAGAAPPSRFSVDAPPLLETNANAKEKEKSPRREYRGLGGGKNNSSSDKMKMKLLSNPYGFSTSDDDDAHSDVFSSDAEDDLAGRGGLATKKLTSESAETFFCSSRSFSSDSSEFYTNKKSRTRSPAAASSKPPPPPPKPQKHAGSSRRHRRAASSACDTCGVRDGFRPVVRAAAAEEQVRKGFAVVKRSRDPYADFRSSMVEMIVGRQLLGAADMERLLRSYLSLNAPRHHPVILQAFSDIWVVVHGG